MYLWCMQNANHLDFLSASSAVRSKLMEFGIVKNFLEGDVILDESSNIKSIPLVLNGSIRVIRTDEDGREIFLYYITSGESCIMSFLGGMQHTSSKVKAIAEEDTEILFIPVDKMNQMIAEYPEWLEYIFRLYHKRFEELLEVVNAVAFKKMDERLLDLIQLKVNHIQNDTLQITHEQIANDLGTARVVISRLLKQMEMEGLLKLGRNKITLLHRKE